MKRAQRVYGEFLDLEAAVDNDEEIMTDEEEEMDRQEMFIHDAPDSEDELPPTHRPFIDYRENDDLELTAGYDALLNKVHGPARQKENYRTWVPTDEEADRIADLLLRPAMEDSPMYRVACKIGREEKIIRSLLDAAQPVHELHSAFTPGYIRGYIYLQCTMNRYLVSLLSVTPGITWTQGLKYQAIDPEDRPKLLALPQNSRSVSIGQWVQVLKGSYKGDVGIVAATHHWGVHLLIVPRLAYTVTADPKGNGKRKASFIRPDPKLFEVEEFQKTTPVQIRTRDGHIYVGRLEFIDGLLYKRYAYSSLSGAVFQMPWTLSSMFAFALKHNGNIDLKRRPRPQEWVFFEEEEVVVSPSRKHGVIRSLKAEYAEVEYENEGTQAVYWYDMQKDIDTGRFLTVLNGPSQGYQGWVIDRTGVVAKVQDTHGISTTGNASTNEPIEIHVNRLRIIGSPFHFTKETPPDDIHIKKTFRHPWCDTEVLISKIGHPRKGEPAIVTAVLDDATGIRLQVQSLRYDPNLPYTKITIDCEDVVETSTRMGLKAFFNIQDPRQRMDVNSQHRSTAVTMPTGGATPMPTETSSTPAWNPSSRTPLAVDHWLSQPSPARVEANEEPQSSQSSRIFVNPPAPHHILLIPQLIGASVRVYINGGKYNNKLTDVTIRRVDGRLGMFHHKLKTYHPLEPEWVTPKIPSYSNDQGLLMVIQGEHCGKHVRRINHIRRNKGAVMILAVVQPVPNSMDTLTGEQLILLPGLLCKVVESENNKTLNKNVMSAIRKEFKS